MKIKIGNTSKNNFDVYDNLEKKFGCNSEVFLSLEYFSDNYLVGITFTSKQGGYNFKLFSYFEELLKEKMFLKNIGIDDETFYHMTEFIPLGVPLLYQQ